MSLRTASRYAIRAISASQAAACAWTAKNAFLVAFLLLLAACGLLILAMREHEGRAREADSVIVFGTRTVESRIDDWVWRHGSEPDVKPSDPPVFSIKQDGDKQWSISITATGWPGQAKLFAISTRSQASVEHRCPASSREAANCEQPSGFDSIVAGSSSSVSKGVTRTESDCTAWTDDGWGQNRVPLNVHEWPFPPMSWAQSTAGGTVIRAIQYFQVQIPAANAEDSRITQSRFTMTCRTALAPMRNGWSDRSIQVWGHIALTDDRFNVNLSDLADHASFMATGGAPSDYGNSELNRVVTQDRNSLIVRWRDEEAAWLRDVVLLAIGALLGIAGACLIEWARPWFEAITRRRKSRRSH